MSQRCNNILQQLSQHIKLKLNVTIEKVLIVLLIGKPLPFS